MITTTVVRKTKVDHITLRLDLEAAKELYATLGKSSNSWEVYVALEAALEDAGETEEEDEDVAYSC